MNLSSYENEKMKTPSRLVPKTLRIVSGGPYQKPSLPFEPIFRSPKHPLAVKLREKYRLFKIAGEGTDFERARRLKSWVRSRWNHGWNHENQQDALDILARAEGGGTFNCGWYSRVFVQCCLAIGLPARMMWASRKNYDFPDGGLVFKVNAGHVISEVYCRELCKWVMLDADANAFYQIDGVPMNSLEVHHAWHADRGSKVKQVLDKPSFVIPNQPSVSDRQNRQVWKDFTRYQTMDFYHLIRTQLLCGFSNRSWPKKGEQRFIYFMEEISPPPPLAMTYKGLNLDRYFFVKEKNHFNWPLDQTFIRAAMIGGKPSRRLEIRLEHNMPFFDHFEVSIAKKPFRRLKGDRSTILLSPGKTLVCARCVDCFGKPGNEANVLVHYKV